MKIESSLSTFFSGGITIIFIGLVSTPVKAITIDLFNDVDDGTRQNAVDLFNDGNSVSNIDGNSSSLNNVLGGIRNITVEKISGSAGDDGLTSALLQTKSDEGIISLSTPIATKGSFKVDWTGDFDGAGANDYVDLTEGGIKDAFAVTVVNNDTGVDLNFDVSDGANTATYSQTVAAGTTGNIYFPFSSFSNQSALSQASSISLYSSEETNGLEFSMSLFQSVEVPFEFSPSLGIILGGSFLGFHALRSRLKRRDELDI